MRPRILPDDRILVDKLWPRLTGLKRGEIVVLRHPRDPERLLVKRIVGLPGESVEMHDGRIWISGRPLSEPYVASGDTAQDSRPILFLGPTDYYVLGDHRADSEDSRAWGAVPRGAIVGRAFLVYWPLSEAGRLP